MAGSGSSRRVAPGRYAGDCVEDCRVLHGCLVCTKAHTLQSLPVLEPVLARHVLALPRLSPTPARAHTFLLPCRCNGLLPQARATTCRAWVAPSTASPPAPPSPLATCWARQTTRCEESTLPPCRLTSACMACAQRPPPCAASYLPTGTGPHGRACWAAAALHGQAGGQRGGQWCSRAAATWCCPASTRCCSFLMCRGTGTWGDCR